MEPAFLAFEAKLELALAPVMGDGGVVGVVQTRNGRPPVLSGNDFLGAMPQCRLGRGFMGRRRWNDPGPRFFFGVWRCDQFGQ
jgi:hypothetical protein